MQRFFETFQPNHYDVYLDINRQTKSFSGTTTVRGTALETTVLLHQKDLQVSEVLLNDQAVDFTIDQEKNSLTVAVKQAGEVKISVSYTAPITDTMMGIYPSYYELNGEKKQLIGTQFETNFARQAFPCVDEPEAKATFSLAIKFDETDGETILANMPEIKAVDGVHYFEETVKMSTYLVAFAFGQMQNKQDVTKSGVKVGVFATYAHDAAELDFALDIAKSSIEFYEDFYQTPYPLPHSWQLALPDFSAGAMENWGLVTYREAYLLVDPNNSSLPHQHRVATVIAHELAHQWFGDLVTMQWWDDLWLNESFANMMEYVCIDYLEPDWNIWETFQTQDAPSALQRDATDGVQSVHVEVKNPEEIDSLFDAAIVYAKGARMLVMVRALIGDDALRAGLKNYFAAHQYGNATGSDLWNALGAASGLDVGAVMHSWLEQPGYPVVEASVVDGQLTLSQKQFFIGAGNEIGRLWQIPLNSNYAAAPALLSDKNIVLGDYQKLRAENKKPFRLNIGNNSHFIVKYDDTLLADLLENNSDFVAIDEFQLLQDWRLLAEGGQMSYGQMIPLLKDFAASESAVVNQALYTAVNNLKKFVEPKSSEEKNLKTFVDALSKDQVERLGWRGLPDESNDDQLMRPYVLSASLYAENPETIAQAHNLFEGFSDDLSKLPAPIRPLVLSSEVKNYGTAKLFNQLLTEYRKSPDAAYQESLRAAVTSVKDPALVEKLVGKFEDAETIKPQDLRGWFMLTLNNPDGQQQAWDWIRNDWAWLEEKVGGDMEFTTYITVISRVFRTPERLAEFKAFFEPKLNQPGLTREIKMDTRVIESRVALIAKEKGAVALALTTEAGMKNI